MSVTDWTICPLCKGELDHETHYDTNDCEHCGESLVGAKATAAMNAMYDDDQKEEAK